MSAHTAGKLIVDGYVIETEDKTPVAVTCPKNSEDTEKANARRLAACWNACDGISTELLEVAPYKDSAAFMGFLKVEAQRDELLAALQALLLATQSVDSAGYIAYIDVEQAVDQATAAIANVAGSAS